MKLKTFFIVYILPFPIMAILYYMIIKDLGLSDSLFDIVNLLSYVITFILCLIIDDKTNKTNKKH